MADYVIAVAAGYLLGAVPMGLAVGYLWLREDIRERGSGKTGTTNVLRTAGAVPAGLVFLGDVAKGVIPAVVGRYVLENDAAAAAGAAAAIVGHVWPVFANFRGGRGVATACGGILGLTPLVALAFPLIAIAIVVPTRTVSVMSVVGAPIVGGVIVVGALLGEFPAAFAGYAVFAVALIEFMHIPNIKRLLAGTEPRIGQGGDRAATG